MGEKQIAPMISDKIFREYDIRGLSEKTSMKESPFFWGRPLPFSSKERFRTQSV